MSPSALRVLSFSSGRRPCGIAAYNDTLTAALVQHADCATVALPAERVPRSRLGQFLRRRAHFAALAARAHAHDVAVLQYHPAFWNHGRPGEDLLPVFLRRVRRPVVAIVHERPEPVAEGEPRGRWRVAKRWGVASLEWLNRGPRLQDAALLVVHSPLLREWLLASGAAEERVVYRPHPVFPIEQPSWGAAEVEERLRLRGRPAVLLFGFPDPRKGFDLALRALVRVPPEVVLVWAGACRNDHERALGEQLLRLATELGLADRFRAVGSVQFGELAALVGRCHLGLAPFREATGSSSVAHMLAAGLPVLASDLRPFETLRCHGAGIELCSTENPALFGEAIADLLRTPQRLRQLRAANVEFAHAHSFQQFVGELVEVFWALAHGDRGQAPGLPLRR